MEDNHVDLIIDTRGTKTKLCRDVKKGEIIKYTNDFGLHIYDCDVLEDVKDDASLQSGNHIDGRLVISADEGTCDCLMVYLLNK